MALEISVYNGPGKIKDGGKPGGKPFIFISCSSRDEEKVFPIVQHLYDTGHRLWLFTEKDTNTAQFMEEFTDRVRQCYVFMAFVSDSYQNSVYCKHEMCIFDVYNQWNYKFVTMLEAIPKDRRENALANFIGGIGEIDLFNMELKDYYDILDGDHILNDCIDERFNRLKKLEEKKKTLEEKKKKLDEEYLDKIRECFKPLIDDKFLKELLTRSSDNASDFYSSRKFERVWKKLSIEQTDYQEELEKIENEIAELEAAEAAEASVPEPVAEPVPEPVAEPVPEPEPVAEPVPEPEPVAEPAPAAEPADQFVPFESTIDPLRPWTDEERAYMLDRITDRNRRLYIDEARDSLCRTIDGILNELFRMSEQGNRAVNTFLTNMPRISETMRIWIDERLDDDSMREIIRRFRTCRGYFDFRAVRTEFGLGDHYDNLLNKLCDYARLDHEIYEKLCSFYDNSQWLRDRIDNVISYDYSSAYNAVDQFKLMYNHNRRNNE